MKTLATALAATFLAVMAASAQPSPSVLANKGQTVATTQDHRAYFFPLDDSAYEQQVRDPQQVKQVLDDILNAKRFMAGDAALKALTTTESAFIALSASRAELLAALSVAERRGKDRANSDPEALNKRAYEIYLVADPATLKREYSADFQHILFDLRGRDFSETAKRIAAAQSDLAAGKTFDDVVATYSDEVRAKETGGKFNNVLAKTMDGVLARTLFDELKDGEYSKPIPSRLGIHIIKRLAVREPIKRPFSEVKESIITRLVEEAGKAAKTEVLQALQVTKTEYNEAAIASLTGAANDPELERKTKEALAEAQRKAAELTASPKAPSKPK